VAPEPLRRQPGRVAWLAILRTSTLVLALLVTAESVAVDNEQAGAQVSTSTSAQTMPGSTVYSADGAGNSHANISLTLELEATSEPVPIAQMINGWEESAQRGEFAYADGRLQLVADYNKVQLMAERRWFYSLRFSPDTVDVYLDAEFGQESAGTQDLSLIAESFEAKGIGVGYEFSGQRWSVTPSFTLYKLLHYQFGEFTGRSFEGDGTNLSAGLSYYFDEYRFPSFGTLPEYQDPQGNASTQWFGYALHLAGEWAVSESWHLKARVRDAWNHFDMFNSAHRQICAEVGEVADPVCASNGAAAGGDDNPKPFTTQIQPSLRLSAQHLPQGWQADLAWYREYVNLTVGRQFQWRGLALTPLVSTQRQLGLAVAHRFGHLTYLVDHWNPDQARDARIAAGFSYSF